MKWDKTIESWGFTWVYDYTERAVMYHKGGEISIMAFEDNEYEVAYINKAGEIGEKNITGLKNLKKFIDKLKK